MASALHHLMKRIRLSVPALANTDGPRGAVSLQSVEDSWFKTAHPLFVSPVLFTHVLRGVVAWGHAKRTGNAHRLLQQGERLEPRMAAQLAAVGTNSKLVRSLFRHPSAAYISD